MKKNVFFTIAIALLNLSLNAQTILKNSKNPFNYRGEQYYNYLDSIKNLVDNNERSLELLLNESNCKNFKFNISLDKEDLESYRIFFSNKIFNLNSILIFENEVLNNNQLSNKNSLLESIAIIKWGYYYFSRDFEYCVNNCMDKKAKEVFDDGNWIDVTFFLLSAPETTAKWYISCCWDCRKK